MRKFVLVVLIVLIFIATATGCSNKTTSPSDSSSSSCCKLIQFLKENPVVKVQVSGILKEVISKERKIILEAQISSTKSTTLVIYMDQNAQIKKVTIDNGYIKENDSTLEELQKTQKSSNRVVYVIILLAPNGDQWEGIYLAFSQS